MSSINSAGGKKNNEDEVRRTREEYQSRDAAKTKKAKRDVKSLNEAHQAEIEALKAQHTEQLTSLKEKTQDAITRRDMEYQREIAEMRKMHGEQLKRAATDNDQKSSQSELALKGEIERSKKTHTAQTENLRQNYAEQMGERDRALQEYTEQSRESQKSAIEGNKARLGEAHQKEMTSLIEERNRRTEHGQMAYEQMRKGKDGTIKTLKRNQEAELARREQAYESQTRNHMEDDKVREGMNRDAFKAGLTQNRERYRKAIDKEKQATEGARGAMADVVENRLGKKIAVLEEQNHSLELARFRDQNASEAKHQNQIKDVKNAFGRNIEDYERQKRELLAGNNEKTKAEMDTLNAKNSSAMNTQSKFYQEKINMDKVRNEERFSAALSDHESAAQTQQINSDARFGKLKNFNDIEREKMAKWYEEASTQMRENFEVTLREIRARNQDEKNKIFANFASQSRENEGKWQDKVNAISMKYEQQIAQLEQKHNETLKDQARQYERVIAESDKKSRSEYDVQAAQLSHRIAKNDEHHKRELDDVKRKHQETLANLLKTRQS